MYKSLNPKMVNMKITFEELLPISSSCGFGAIEYDPVHIRNQVGIKKALDLMGQYGIILSSFGLPVKFQGTEEEFNKSFVDLEVTASTASQLGCHRCGTYVFSWSDELDYAENFALHTHRLRLCAEVLKRYSIDLALEFLGPKTLRDGHKYSFIHNMDDMLKLCDAIGTGNVGIMLDAYHAYTAHMVEDDFLKIVRDESDIVLVHINDAPKGQKIDTLPDTLRYLPGDGGAIDLKKFLSALDTLGYTGPVIVEPFSEKLAAMQDPNEIASLVCVSYDDIWPN
jgi:sugar phosphate isomerase/epimerase